MRSFHVNHYEFNSPNKVFISYLVRKYIDLLLLELSSNYRPVEHIRRDSAILMSTTTYFFMENVVLLIRIASFFASLRRF